MLDACATAGFSPDFAVDSENHATTAQGLGAAGLGIGMIPLTGLRSPHPGVVVRKVRRPEPVRAVHAAVRDTAPDTPAPRGLLDALRDASVR